MTLYYLLSTIPLLILFALKTKKALHMLQQNYYDESFRYLKWIITNIKKIIIAPDILFILLIMTIFIPQNISIAVFAVLYIICSYLYYKELKTEQSKKPLVVTKRVKRQIMMITLVTLIPYSTIFYINNSISLGIFYLILGLYTYLTYFVVFFANRLCFPIEKQVHNHYRRQAIKKLKSMNNLKVVGITGSYGKTSSKNILNDILSVKFDCLPTPKNYNTPIGLISTINNNLDKFSEIFIAEMGAFKIGEIKQCCDLVKPKYGILTKIGTAHLVSFGSQENIQKGKFELIESLPKDGVGVLNGDDELQLNYKRKNDCKILWIGINNPNVDVRALNIKGTNKGMTFDVKFKNDENIYSFQTKLLGTANIYNILAGIALGKYLGMSIDELILGVKKVKTIEHRLEMKKLGNINIIDDAYNSNPVGSKMALEVLNLMPGKKIIVTPGMIELGSEQEKLNKKFGEYISEVCDEVILIGEQQTKPILSGLKEKKYNENKIHILNDVKQAFPLINTLKENDTYVLLENDLPDIFNEK